MRTQTIIILAAALLGAAGCDEAPGAPRDAGSEGATPHDLATADADGGSPPQDAPREGPATDAGADGAAADDSSPTADVAPPPGDGVTPGDAPAAVPSFPGHQPGKIYLGYGVDNASCPAGSSLAVEQSFTGPTRLDRFYQGNINATSTEVSRFKSSLTDGKLAWISFKGSPHTWKQIAAGAADAALTAKAVAYQGIPGPGLITFHHEPAGDGDAADYVAAWHRILDVWQAAGGTGYVTPCPVLNGFFLGYPNGGKGYTDAQMAEWMPDALIERFRVIGFDGYDAGSYADIGIPVARTIRKWREWLLRRQALIADGLMRHLAMGEVGVFYATTKASIATWPTSGEGEFPGGYPGWDTVWKQLVAAGVGDGSYVAVNYFNSIINTRANADWSLRARRPTTGAEDLACDSGNEQPPPGPGVADAARVQQFKASLQSAQVADVTNWTP